MKSMIVGLFLGFGFAVGQKAAEAALAYGALKLASYKLGKLAEKKEKEKKD